ncbi:hypothetical protein GQX74_008910 [Glossina fuscipes]|nr:hypothetical protein GQX74_008910 [Glossina fuscipes]
MTGSAAAGANTMGQHQTMFFGPAHTYSQYNSLPRRGMTSAFQRNTPIRRSAGIPEHHIEYFVPRSVSEFNLSGVGDLALPPPRRCSPTVPNSGLGLPHGLQLGPPQALLCAPMPLPPSTAQPQMQVIMKPREKMVTFEDEPKGIAPPPPVSGTCPHGVPTTPRKSSTGASEDMFGLANKSNDIMLRDLEPFEQARRGSTASEPNSLSGSLSDLKIKSTPGDVIRV